MLSGFVFNPIGAHSTDATISAATTLTPPTGANVLRIQALAQVVRYTLDGTAPEAAVGFRLLVNEETYIEFSPAAVIKVIEETASASIQYQWGNQLPIAGNRPART